MFGRSPKQKRAKARPDEILDAALEEFQTSGFDAARMGDIAARAGLSKAGVYLYFPSKEELLKALIVRSARPVAERAESLAALDGVEPIQAIRMLYIFAFDRMRDPMVSAAPRIVLAVAPRFPEIADFYRNEVLERGRAALTKIIRRGIAKGQFRDVPVETALRALIGPIVAYVILNHVFGLAAVQDEADEAAAQFEAFMLGLEARP